MGRILNICEVGNPLLAIKCEEVDIKNINKKPLEEIEDMKSTLEFSEGYGIAAPQVGINKRIIIINLSAYEKLQNLCNRTRLRWLAIGTPLFNKVSYSRI